MKSHTDFDTQKHRRTCVQFLPPPIPLDHSTFPLDVAPVSHFSRAACTFSYPWKHVAPMHLANRIVGFKRGRERAGGRIIFEIFRQPGNQSSNKHIPCVHRLHRATGYVKKRNSELFSSEFRQVVCFYATLLNLWELLNFVIYRETMDDIIQNLNSWPTIFIENKISKKWLKSLVCYLSWGH